MVPPNVDTRFFNWRRDRKALLMMGGGACVLIAISCVFDVWGDRRPVGSFFEEFVARTAYWGSAIGSFIVAIWAAASAKDKFNSNLLAWIAGIVVFGAIVAATSYIFDSIPGVGWRFDRLAHSSGDE